MKNNTNYLKMIIASTAITFLMGCETGVKNRSTMTTNTTVPSGIVDKGTAGYVGSQKSSVNTKTSRIFSSSARPGYYIQVGYYGQEKPNKSFVNRLDNSNFNYIVLDKNGDYYALVGPYISYNQAKTKMPAVKSSLNYKAFVIEVLRP